MKKALLFTSLIMASSVYAHELPNYAHVKGAVTHGAKIRIATDFTKCVAQGRKASGPAFKVGVYTPNEVIVDNDNNVLFNLKHFTFNDQHVPGKAVYQYVTYKISPDNTVTMVGEDLDALNLTPLTEQHTYVCKMTEGAHIYVD